MKTTTRETQTDIAYGVTSLTATAAPPVRLLNLNRGHVTLYEDAGRTPSTAFSHSVVILNNQAIGRAWTNLAKGRRYYDAHPDQALQLLLAPKYDFVRTAGRDFHTIDGDPGTLHNGHSAGTGGLTKSYYWTCTGQYDEFKPARQRQDAETEFAPGDWQSIACPRAGDIDPCRTFDAVLNLSLLCG